MTSNAVPKTSKAMNNPITALKKTFKIKRRHPSKILFPIDRYFNRNAITKNCKD
jgi:hypothetical protein